MRHSVIIGGGISGTLCARALARAGWRVTLLEGTHLGAGSSSRTAAGIRQQFSTPGTVRGMRYAVSWYRAFANEIGGKQSPIVQRGYLFLLDDSAAMADAAARVAMQQAQGLHEVALLDGDALRERFPWVSEHLVGATFCPTDGFLLPHLIYEEAATRARALGATIVQGAPVTGATVVGDRITSVKTPKGDFSADLFIDCTNAWTRRLGALVGGEDLPVAPLKRYLWFVARGDAMPAATLREMPLVVLPSGAYCRPENADSLMMGKKHDTPADDAFSYDDQDTIEARYAHQGGADAYPYALWAEVAECLPPVGDFAGIDATTGGYYATTPDHNPFLGYDRQRTNLIRLVGHSGHGAMFGPFTALVAEQLAEAGRDIAEVRLPEGAPVPLDAFAIGRAFHAPEAMVI